MNEKPPTPASTFEQAVRSVEELERQLQICIVGQETVVRRAVIGLVTGGHLLIEGVPGLGKTLLAKAMAQMVGGSFNRIQFTPDLMPADIIGHSIFDSGDNRFTIRKGPVFCHVLVADEINRAPAKTQAALLEAMQEQQVTIDGQSLSLERPFLVLATQNPVEQEGTYPLPQAQTDRFMFNLRIDFPDRQAEEKILALATTGRVGDGLDTDGLPVILTPHQIDQIQQMLAGMTVDPQVVGYCAAIVRMTRDWSGIEYGAGPRAGIHLVRAARGAAMVAGRDFVTPDDVKSVALPVLRHRIVLTPELDIEGYDKEQILGQLLETVKAPRR